MILSKIKKKCRFLGNSTSWLEIWKIVQIIENFYMIVVPDFLLGYFITACFEYEYVLARFSWFLTSIYLSVKILQGSFSNNFFASFDRANFINFRIIFSSILVSTPRRLLLTVISLKVEPERFQKYRLYKINKKYLKL